MMQIIKQAIFIIQRGRAIKMNEAIKNLNKAWNDFINKLKWWKGVTIEHNMMLKSRDMGNGKFEVCGVVFYADSHTEALRKYRRAKGLL